MLLLRVKSNEPAQNAVAIGSMLHSAIHFLQSFFSLLFFFSFFSRAMLCPTITPIPTTSRTGRRIGITLISSLTKLTLNSYPFIAGIEKDVGRFIQRALTPGLQARIKRFGGR